MLAHLFYRPHSSDPDHVDFLKEVRRGTFRGAFDEFIGKLLCFTRIHVASLEGDGAGFYRICDRCRHYEPVTIWSTTDRSRKPPQLR